ncbi:MULTISPECIES: ribosome assembly RNA-binding protein YhbY [unclassified Fusibacter]|uniref:ribosome assembly RNA-binding protein YhbY n=1 Tax=unclassified Fusibacter TaxID=2624464 RepID=UPI0010135C4C|nr:MULTISPECIES: ribosome assembly RNA-binding protein YhbY [unclassified Fusibacter]MCK8060683.1 ribosome assembly RNA-binding protein YhbY [Fusibacter sp. A2]NPE22863.1 ribosome assembly RNA-binding protein YhbY [Fusibacter sp. A1]RXV59932.1 ribosome assembly RNA-binding protein YhbY [Fusibacter sp. A1]
MLSGKQRSYLKGLANPLKPVLQLGKEGITPTFIKQVAETIEKRELIKISVLESCDIDIKEAANTVAGRTQSEFVQAVGRKFVIYKRNNDKPVIELPKIKKTK